MAALVLGAVGAGIGGAIGGTFLGMSAASIGWMVGSTIGNLAGQKSQHTEGARLSDLAVQASTYGGMVPLMHGALRTAGNIIWSTDKMETATTTEVGGKGGPSVSQTTYSYHVNMAVALCQGPAAAVRKIWSNGKLIYDNSASATAATIIASSLRAEAMRFYPGSQTQLPDPTIEAALGPGNAPAYRGTAYVVFDRLECPNGQIPQLHFEVVTQGATADRLLPYGSLPAGESGSQAYLVFSSATKAYAWYADTGNAYVGTGSAFGSAGRAQFDNTPELAPGEVFGFRAAYPVNGAAKVGRVASFRPLFAEVVFQFLSIPKGNLSQYGPYPYEPDDDWGGASQLAFDSVTGHYAVQAPGINPYPRVINGKTGGMTKYAAIPGGTSATTKFGIALYDGVLYTLSLSGSSLVCCVHTDVGTYSTISVYTGTISNAEVHAGPEGVFVYCYSTAAGTGRIYRIQGGAATLVTDQAGACLPDRTPAFRVGDTHALLGIQSDGAKLLQLRAVTDSDVPVATVIADYCAAAGLQPGQVDTSALTGSVPGVAVTRLTSARAALQPLLSAWFIDAAETDGQLRFFHRAGRAPVAAIAWGDLAAAPESAAAEAVDLTRTQEAELPRSIAVNFMNTLADYQGGTETARRQVTQSVNDQSLDLTIATTPDHAATVAQGLLYTAWAERMRRSISVTRRYASLDAGDVVSAELSPGQWSQQLVTKAMDDAQTIALDLLPYATDALAATAQGASSAQAQNGIAVMPDTLLALLDIPALREADMDAGLYAALTPETTGWPGAVVVCGAPGAELASQGAVTRAAAAGYLAQPLGAWHCGQVDEVHHLLVQLVHGTLSSATRDAVLDGQINAAVVGGTELLQFTTAAHLGAGLWRLSGLVRGLRGTEHHASAGHTVGAPFVLVSAGGVLRLPRGVGEQDLLLEYRAPTIGQPITQAAPQQTTSQAQALRPFSPVNARRSRNSAGDLHITWDRRTRSLQTFPSGLIDLPLFEDTQAYQVDVFSDATFTAVVRTLATSTPDVHYTAAQQSADFGATQAAVHVRIHQLGRVGRGHHLQATL